MTAEVGRALSAQNRQLMQRSDNLELERGAAAKTKTKIDKRARESSP